MCLFLFSGAVGQPTVNITGLVSMMRDSEYAPLEENLIVVETTQEGEPIEKRFAGNADLFFYRQLKAKVLFGVGGVKGYENELVLSLLNISGRKLLKVSVIEKVPLEIAPSASKIVSDYNFLVLNERPAIIEFFIEEMEQNREKRLSYKLYESEKMASLEMLELMEAPRALIALEEGSCIGIVCKDLLPCTLDYCEAGKCMFEPMPDGTECSEGKQCLEGKCIEAQGLNVELAGLVFLFGAIALGLTAWIITRKWKKGKG